jgi:hypothetical protein
MASGPPGRSPSVGWRPSIFVELEPSLPHPVSRPRPARYRAGAAARSRARRSLPLPRGAALHTGRLARRQQNPDRLRDLIHPPLLQTAAAAHTGRDPRRHPALEQETEGLLDEIIGKAAPHDRPPQALLRIQGLRLALAGKSSSALDNQARVCGLS